MNPSSTDEACNASGPWLLLPRHPSSGSGRKQLMRFGKFDVRFLGGAGALAFALLIIMSVDLRQGTDWWAAWGQWVGGIGSIVAAGAAFWIASAGWKKSDAQLLAIHSKEERELASHFGVWIDKSYGSVVIVGGSFGQQNIDHWYVVKVLNGTPLPMYDVHVAVNFHQRQWVYSHQRPVVGPASVPIDFELEGGAFQHFLDLAVGAAREARRGDPHRELANLHGDNNSDPDRMYIIERVTMTVEFTDGNNVRWQRTVPGELSKVTPWPPKMPR
jgi:hypothetical protein